MHHENLHKKQISYIARICTQIIMQIIILLQLQKKQYFEVLHQ